jgi:hypothetical protein
MFILCGIGFGLATLIGGLIGLTLTKAHYDQIEARQRQYETEIAEYREFYAALALYRRFKAGKSPDDKVSAA